MAYQNVNVPALQETLLMLELEAQEFCVDLSAVSQIILADLGATLQVLRLVGREYGDCMERPCRIEDCIAAMGVHAALEAISAFSFRFGRPSQAMAGLWSHSKQIGAQSRRIAEHMCGVDPDQAYYVGLFHSIGSLPALLGWSGSKSQRVNVEWNGLEMAREWALPSFVTDYFSGQQKGGGRSLWLEIVQTAHRSVGEPDGACVATSGHRGELLWAV